MSHRGPALGYVFHELRPARRLRSRKGTREAGLIEGPDFGRVQRGETVNGVSSGAW